MYRNILSEKQVRFLPLIKKFTNDFYLVGGTAIALQINHRRSVDFDLFTNKEINQDRVLALIKEMGFDFQTVFIDGDQMHGYVNEVKLTFYEYPFKISHNEKFEEVITMPSLKDLAAMKVYALGRRAKWKDYVDVYFILRDCYSFEEICERAEEIFGSIFNRKLLRQQLSYFTDIDYTETVDFIGTSISDDEVKNYLIKIATKKI